MTSGLDPRQVRQFKEDGFLIVRDVLPSEAFELLIEEIDQKIDAAARQAVEEGLLDKSDRFENASFAHRAAMLSGACSDPDWFWGPFRGKPKTRGLFTLRTHSALLDVVESLIGPEILAHPQYNLRPMLPDHDSTVVPWHQDLAYLVPEDVGETLVANCWVPLVKATATNGCLDVMRGSHRLGLLTHDLKKPHYHGILDADLPKCDVVTCEVDVGDILLTMERVVHRSRPNKSDTVRWSVDTRYSVIGQPTGRAERPGFVARSRRNPQSVAKTVDDWIHLFEQAGLDPTETPAASA